MKTLFEQGFEGGLECINVSLTKKSDVKTYKKVVERIGRLKQKYSSASGRYIIEVEKQTVPVSVNNKSKSAKTKEICTALKWEKKNKLDAKKQEECGVYFSKTSIKEDQESLVWTI